jgi:hypothetical protein
MILLLAVCIHFRNLEDTCFILFLCLARKIGTEIQNGCRESSLCKWITDKYLLTDIVAKLL